SRTAAEIAAANQRSANSIKAANQRSANSKTGSKGLTAAQKAALQGQVATAKSAIITLRGYGLSDDQIRAVLSTGSLKTKNQGTLHFHVTGGGYGSAAN